MRFTCTRSILLSLLDQLILNNEALSTIRATENLTKLDASQASFIMNLSYMEAVSFDTSLETSPYTHIITRVLGTNTTNHDHPLKNCLPPLSLILMYNHFVPSTRLDQ
jgi:hypothetical protein